MFLMSEVPLYRAQGDLVLPQLGWSWSRIGCLDPLHQQPEVNYLPRFSPQLISLERYTLSVYGAGEIDLFENLDIVHIRLLVVVMLVAAILCTGGPDVLRKEAWPFYRTISVSAYVGSSKNLKDLKDQALPFPDSSVPQHLPWETLDN